MPNNPLLNPNSDVEDIKDELLSLSFAFRDATDSIVQSIRSINAKQGTYLDTTLVNARGYIKEIDKYYNSAMANVGKGIKGELRRKDIANEIVKIETTSRKLHAEIRSIEAQAAISTGKKRQELLNISLELKNQEDAMQDIVELQRKEIDDIDNFTIKRLQPLKGIFEGLRKIPIFGDIINPTRGIEKMEQAARDGKNLFQTFRAGMKGTFEGMTSITTRLSIMFGVISAVRGAIKFIVDTLFMADKQITSISKNLMVSKDAAVGLRSVFIEFGKQGEDIYFTTANIVEAQTKLNELLKVGSIFRQDILENQIVLTKEIGLSDEEASNLNKNFVLNNKEANRGRISILDQVAALKNQRGILLNGREVLKDVARVSGQIASLYKNQLDSISKAVVRVQSLGLSLEQAKNMGMSLLDFQSSIGNELEAELLLGKEINLEKARGLALQGKVDLAAKEMIEQVGTLEDFQNMNVILQNSIAKAIGLSSDELADALANQKFLVGATKQQYDELVRIGKREQADALLKQVSTGKSLDSSLRSLDVQEKFNQALEKAKEIFSNLVNTNILDKLVNVVTDLTVSLSKFGLLSTLTGRGIGKARMERENNDFFKDLTQMPQSERERFVEIVSKKMQNDYWEQVKVNAIMQPVSNILLTSSRTKREIASNQLTNEAIKEFNESKINKPQDDFILKNNSITPFRKDDIIVGGTNLFGTSKESQEMLDIMKELLSEIKKGGVVLMDGQKVGTSLMMGSYKLA